MFCPDCGRESRDPERYCPVCGYPLDDLIRTLHTEKKNSLGWAEKILGKQDIKPSPPTELPLVSFKTGEEPKSEKKEDEKGLRCERCGVRVEVGTICPKCGDRLPAIVDVDPFLGEVFRGFYRMVLAPRQFAITFPYPATGGAVQPYLLPGIFTAVFVVMLTLAYAKTQPGKIEIPQALLPALIGIPIFIIGIPFLVFITAGLIHLVAVILGGRAPYRRALRVISAVLIWVLILGTLSNLSTYALYTAEPGLVKLLDIHGEFERALEISRRITPFVTGAPLVLIGWLYAWMFGSLYRLSWWKTVVHTLATYVALFWWIWLFIVVVLPLRAGGFL